jgi:threonine synthase
MTSFRLLCSECGAAYAEDRALLVCPTCSQLQEPGGITRGVLEVEIEELPRAWPVAPPASGEFLAAFLPIASAASLAPLPVGGTPLLDVPRLRRELEMPNLWLKDDTRNPSGSTKDRASLLVVAKAVEYGFVTVAAASTGNAATALAAVAAAAGVRAVVFVPAAAPRAKLVQMASYGARVVPVQGSYDDAFELCLAACREFGWYNRNTALNPFTIEGKKTAALEIACALSGRADAAAPDAVVVPTGDGVILAGVAKGFADLVRAGLLARLPRLIAVQPAGSAAIVDAFARGTDDVRPVPDAASVADSLVVQAPRNALLCLRRLRESGGAAVAVADEAILDAIGRLARATGVFAEPAAAASLAGLLAARDRGLVDRDERVVLLVTGTGLKDVDAAARTVHIPSPIPPRLDAVAPLLA